MGIRNCEDIGENLRKIMKRLMANDNLLKLLYYTDKDPFSHEPLTDEQKREYVFDKLIRVVPRVGTNETSNAIVVIKVDIGTLLKNNSEFKDLGISIEVFVPMTQWIVKSDNLRPFLIMGEIEKSLRNKTVNGLGKMEYSGFELDYLTDEISCYEMRFNITSYE